MSGIQDALGQLVIKRLEAKNDDVVAITNAVVAELQTANAVAASKAASTLDENLERKLKSLESRGLKPGMSEYDNAIKDHREWTKIIMSLVTPKGQ